MAQASRMQPDPGMPTLDLARLIHFVGLKQGTDQVGLKATPVPP
jgi:hypothetical protein